MLGVGHVGPVVKFGSVMWACMKLERVTVYRP